MKDNGLEGKGREMEGGGRDMDVNMKEEIDKRREGACKAEREREGEWDSGWGGFEKEECGTYSLSPSS